jgi:hypothetical protein
MVDIIEIQNKRFNFLHTLYDESNANEFAYYKKRDVGEEIGVDVNEAETIVSYLRGEGLVRTTKEDVAISHYGIIEVEAARTHPEKETDHFPANIIHVDTMIGSQIMQASPGATQAIEMNVLTADERQKIEKALSLLKGNIDEIQLPPDQKSDLQAEIDTTEAQLRLSKPMRTRIMESVNSIKAILQPIATGSAIALQIIQLLSMLHH